MLIRTCCGFLNNQNTFDQRYNVRHSIILFNEDKAIPVASATGLSKCAAEFNQLHRFGTMQDNPESFHYEDFLPKWMARAKSFEILGEIGDSANESLAGRRRSTGVSNLRWVSIGNVGSRVESSLALSKRFATARRSEPRKGFCIYCWR
jgi:hypothetical protein